MGFMENKMESFLAREVFPTSPSNFRLLRRELVNQGEDNV